MRALCLHQDKGGGAVGQRFRDEIELRATKLQEPPPPKDVRPLPVPPESSGKRCRRATSEPGTTPVGLAAAAVDG